MRIDKQLFKERGTATHLMALAAFNLALFLPMMGRGYIHDDFVWIFDVAYQPRWYGFTHTAGGPFYAPLTWLTFKLDWLLWGAPAFVLAAENLTLHITNMLLLYWLAWRLWQSKLAAVWAATGFALLFPANVWAVMWIATRGHLLAAFFYLAALHATLWYLRAERRRLLAATAIVAAAAAAMFAKESGVTVIVAIAAVIFFYRRERRQKIVSLADLALLAALVAALAAYLLLRAQSGAVPVFSRYVGYRYSANPRFFIENFLRYAWRTCGLLAILAASIAGALMLGGHRPRLAAVRKDHLLLSATLFVVAIAPFIALDERSGIYTYLPGLAAALGFASVARAMLEPERESVGAPLKFEGRKFAPLAYAPVALVIVAYIAFTIGQSMKWMRMAQTNRAVLRQIAEQHPQAAPRTVFFLSFAEDDRRNRFPQSFSSYGLMYALRLLYGDPSVDGVIVRQGEALPKKRKRPRVYFSYLADGKRPQVLKSSEVAAARFSSALQASPQAPAAEAK